MNYKGTKFFRLVRNGWIQGGGTIAMQPTLLQIFCITEEMMVVQSMVQYLKVIHFRQLNINLHKY